MICSIISKQRKAFAACLLSTLCAITTGCSEAPAFPNASAIQSPSETSATDNQARLNGRTHGGQQPITGARIYLFAAGRTGYGSASTSLLTATSLAGYPTKQDENGRYYVTTDPNGSFQIADSCTPGQQVYLASVGGNPGGGTNPVANEIAILGQCPQAGNFDSTLADVIVSEISTVVAAFSASAYAADTFDIGAPSTTTLEQTGIANAFANAANMFDVQNPSDVGRTTTVAGNGIVPQTKIHTLANILAACVNSTGASSACSILFANAKSSGTTGSTPTDITTAAINIAHNPSANLSTLYGIQTAVTPFLPQLSSTPSSFALTLTFKSAAHTNNPSLAVDASGNVWTVAPGDTVATELSPMGKVLSGTGGFETGGHLRSARGLALDTGNNLWILGTDGSSNSTLMIAELNNSGAYQETLTESSTLSGDGGGFRADRNAARPLYAYGDTSYTHPPTSSTNLVIDGSGNLYYSAARTSSYGTSNACCTEEIVASSNTISDLDSGNANPGTNFIAVGGNSVWASSNSNSLSYLSNSRYGGTSKIASGGLTAASGLALDSSGRAWVVNSGANSLSEFSNSGNALTGNSGFTGGGLSTPKNVAVCGLGNIWVTNNAGSYTMSEFTAAGSPIGNGFSAQDLTNASALAVDGSGNIWVASSSSTTLVEFVGIAAPVLTPTASAITSGMLGTRP